MLLVQGWGRGQSWDGEPLAPSPHRPSTELQAPLNPGVEVPAACPTLGPGSAAAGLGSVRCQKSALEKPGVPSL